MLHKFIDRAREDSLTAAIFSHLLHLPCEDFWSILREACGSKNFPGNPGEPLLVHPWPSWGAAGTYNEHRVVPDLVIEFAGFDLIIEAKYGGGRQYRGQWRNELIAYTNEYGSRRREVRMLALGGVPSREDDLVEQLWRSNEASKPQEHQFRCPVFMCEWEAVLLECRRMHERLEKVTERSSQSSAHLRILQDLIGFFSHHGYAPIWWFQDFDFTPHLLDVHAESDQQFFRDCNKQFHKS